jgi:hypothetical protein
MNVESRIKWTLYASLAMVSPAILNAWHGRLETTDFAKYFLIAFFSAWFATGLLHKVLIYFKFDTIRRAIETNGIQQPRRRRSDRPPAQANTADPTATEQPESVEEQPVTE